MMERDLKDKFAAFVGRLTPDECREQLVLAYLQMERCLDVLHGRKKTTPVEMRDNGESSDLELFYTCRKVRDELDLLDGEVRKMRGTFGLKDDKRHETGK